MSCDAYADAILDLARGAEIEAGTKRLVEAHLTQCAGCGARLRREQALTADLAVLAKGLLGAHPSGALEARLLEAFHDRHTPAVPAPGSSRSDWRPWLAAAAAVIVLAGIGFGWRGAAGTRGDGRPVPLGTNPTTSTANLASPAIPERTPAGVGHATPPAVRGRPPRGGRASFLRPTGFVALPGAASLPEFESGTIDRVRLALSSLPVYGVDIAPDTASPIEADLLVGQDGQPRAIRLVTIASESRSRQ